MQGAQNPNAAQVVSPFPAPPEYAKHYTAERIVQGNVLPPPPVPNEFIVFGEEFKLDDDVIRSLASQKISQLYSNKNDWKSEVKKLNKSAVAAFLDLLDMLIRCPDHPERGDKMNDIQTIFINMHHLINEYRPLQARDTMKLMQQEQLKDMEEITERFKHHLSLGKQALRVTLDMSNVKLHPVPPLPEGLDIESDDDELGDRDEIMDTGSTSDAVHTSVSSPTTPVKVQRNAKPNKPDLKLRHQLDQLSLDF